MTASINGQVQFINPEGLNKNRAFTNVIAASGQVKTVYIGGQDTVEATGAIIGKGDIQLQTEQVLKNLQIALKAAGAKPQHIIKWSIYAVQGQPIQPAFKVFQRVWGSQSNLPAVTMMFVSGLAHPDFQVEMDAIAVVPG